jgi:hypothetical protein
MAHSGGSGMTTTDTMLRELGYAATTAGISSFQRDYNRVGTRPLRITGELDKPTLAALELAHSTADVFKAVRNREAR